MHAGHEPGRWLSAPLPNECLVRAMPGAAPTVTRHGSQPQTLHRLPQSPGPPAPYGRACPSGSPQAPACTHRWVAGGPRTPAGAAAMTACREAAGTLAGSAGAGGGGQSCRDHGDKPSFIPTPPQTATPGRQVAGAGGTQGTDSIMAVGPAVHSALWLPPVPPGCGTPATAVTPMPCQPQGIQPRRRHRAPAPQPALPRAQRLRAQPATLHPMNLPVTQPVTLYSVSPTALCPHRPIAPQPCSPMHQQAPTPGAKPPRMPWPHPCHSCPRRPPHSAARNAGGAPPHRHPTGAPALRDGGAPDPPSLAHGTSLMARPVSLGSHTRRGRPGRWLPPVSETGLLSV